MEPCVALITVFNEPQVRLNPRDFKGLLKQRTIPKIVFGHEKDRCEPCSLGVASLARGMPIAGSRESIADARLGQDIARVRWIGLDFLADMADVHS